MTEGLIVTKEGPKLTLCFIASGELVPCYVYMLSSRPHGTLYLGVTSDLGRRIIQHKQKVFSGFSCHYGVHRLVWMEEYDLVVDAIAREKMLKKWRRAWKVELIEALNPKWADLTETLNW